MRIISVEKNKMSSTGRIPSDSLDNDKLGRQLREASVCGHAAGVRTVSFNSKWQATRAVVQKVRHSLDSKEKKQMDPITLVLGIASGVLIGVTTDLITGKSKSVRKSEIEKEVSDQLLKKTQEQRQADLLTIKRKIMDEVEILAGRNPDLAVSPDDIRLRTPVKRPIFHRDEAIKKQLISRLETLGEIVVQRREELGLPLRPEDTTPQTAASDQEETTVAWKKVERQKPPSRWEQELLDMEDRIRSRRSEEKKGNE